MLGQIRFSRSDVYEAMGKVFATSTEIEKNGDVYFEELSDLDIRIYQMIVSPIFEVMYMITHFYREY